jgi:predicted alpha/beta superfamily hydrolase
MKGIIETHKIIIPYTGTQRAVHIYLPAAYKKRPRERFPVLYMHDGQNVFDDKTAFGGHSWRMAETLLRLESERGVPVIAAALEHAGEKRIDEYSPWKCDFQSCPAFAAGRGGQGAEYAAFFAGGLKEFIDANYRTLPNRESTVIMGSSMGGLISLYLAAKYPHIYGAAGILSPACWFARAEIEDFIRATRPTGQRYYIYAGTEENHAVSFSQITAPPDFKKLYVDCAISCAALLSSSGVAPDSLRLKIEPGAVHSEAAWAKQAFSCLSFMNFP